MNSWVTIELKEMQESLQEVAFNSDNVLQKAERSTLLVRQHLEKVREHIQEENFEKREDEIHFFKNEKPLFLKELFYWMEVYFTEAGRPFGTKEALTAYFQQISELIRLFCYRNQSLYVYYRTGKTHRDGQYFLRETDDPLSAPAEYLPDMDPRFCTVHSYKLGKLLAYERLSRYIQSELQAAEHPFFSSAPEGENKPTLLWTDAKVGLVELAYAIYSRGAVNQGKTDVKQIISTLEEAFNIDLGNYYGAFQDMRIRKKNRTVYLDQLKEYLVRRMDEADALPR